MKITNLQHAEIIGRLFMDPESGGYEAIFEEALYILDDADAAEAYANAFMDHIATFDFEKIKFDVL